MARDPREFESATLPFDDIAVAEIDRLEARTYPVIAVRDSVYFPGQVFPLFAADPQSLNAVRSALAADGQVVLVMARRWKGDSAPPDALFSVGIVAELLNTQAEPADGGGLRLLLEGLHRVRLTEVALQDGGLTATGTTLSEPKVLPGDVRLAALSRTILAGFEGLSREGMGIPSDAVAAALASAGPDRLPDLVAPWLDSPLADKQALLEETAPERRLERLAELIDRERKRIPAEPIEIEPDESESSEWEDLLHRLEIAAPPPEVARRADAALKRLARAPGPSPETEGLQHWLETILSIPWNAEAQERVDLAEATGLLDATHSGLSTVKERLLEFLAVRKLAGNRLRAPLLCFVGAPGVGKTGVALSLAEALGRPSVRVALGGVRDEAEIRGHRRTYVGAMPGRLVAAVRQSGVKNPVIILDELDKLASDLRGDPASALLEALDPEQNHAFHDHFLDVPLDLSQAIFVATANRLDTILPALRDRLEIVSFPSYTEREKIGIAQSHLLPRQRLAHALDAGDLPLTDAVLAQVIRGWTSEAGVRELERKLGALCRKAVLKLAEGKQADAVTESELETWLGSRPLRPDPLPPPGSIGVALGLAFTERGGETLPVEAALTSGPAEETRLIVTGSAGDVLQESARTALSFVASNLHALELPASALLGKVVHIHFPSGATPKDGPSAGIAIACALASALVERSLPPNLALTGELSLRGQALPVGGLRDKLLAAVRAGVTQVIVPQANVAEVESLDREVTAPLHILGVASGLDALRIALSAN